MSTKYHVPAPGAMPAFRTLPDKTSLLRIGSRIFRIPERTIFDYWNNPRVRTDGADILIRLIDAPGWNDKLPLIKTPGGGLQQDANTRIHELRAGLKTHGLGIACLETPIPGQRKQTSYRLCWEDEVLSKNGRVAPYGHSHSRAARDYHRVSESKPAPPRPGWHSQAFQFGRNPGNERKPAQSATQKTLFDTRAFVGFETGGRR